MILGFLVVGLFLSDQVSGQLDPKTPIRRFSSCMIELTGGMLSSENFTIPSPNRIELTLTNAN